MKKTQIFESDIFSHLASMRYMPRWIVLIVDIVLCNLSYFLAVIFAKGAYEFTPTFDAFLPEWAVLTSISCLAVVSFWLFHTYSGVLRYSNFVDIVKLLCAIGLQVIVMYAGNWLCNILTKQAIFLRLSILFYAMISFFMLMSLRLIIKVTYDFLISHNGRMKAVAVYGTKSAGVAMGKMIRSNESWHFRLAAFIDEGAAGSNKFIFNVPVISTDNKANLLRFLKRRKIRTIIVSPLKMKEIVPERDLEVFVENGIEVLTVPSLGDWNEEKKSEQRLLKATPNDFKTLRIEDLLNRQPIQMSMENVASYIKDKTVMVTGAAGSIGSEIVRQVAKLQPHLLIMFDTAETPMHNLRLELLEAKVDCPVRFCMGDMRSQKRLENVIRSYGPNVIFHAAAYKHVPMMEDAPSECVIANVQGTRYIADLAVKYGVDRFVMISTDKAVNPTNVMGASKRIAEIYVQSLFRKNAKNNPNTTKFITTRFGNVLGSNGSVIPLFRHQIEMGGPVTVTHPDIIRYFMTIPEACQLVLEAGSMGEGGEIFIFDMGRPVKIVDLARKMIRLAGYKPEIDIPIVYSGLRPGEKLYEELLNVKETTQPTYHEKIMIAKVCEYDYNSVSSQIDELMALARSYNNFSVVEQMKRIVPEYISKNSQYERLDNRE